MERTTERLPRCVQIARTVLPGVLLALGLGGCDREAPTATEPRAVTTREAVDLALARQEVAGLAVALEDARTRILPTLGNDAAAEALGSALGELQRALSQAEVAVREHAVEPVTAAERRQVEVSLLLDSEAPLRRAHAAWAQLRASASRRPDVDVVLLVLERITAAARGPAEPVPGDAQPTAGDRREE